MKRWMVPLLLVAACKFPELDPLASDGGDDDGGDGGSDAPAAPVVMSTIPADDATDVEPTATITATFSAPMLATTVTGDSVIVRRHGQPVAGAVTYDEVSRTATFTPAGRLALLGDYTVTITTAAAAADGRTLASDHGWSFEVRDGSWSTPQLLESAAAEVYFPRPLIDRAGNTVVTWFQENTPGGALDIYANRNTAGTWSNATQVDQQTDTVTAYASVIDPTGAATVLYRTSGTALQAWARRYVPGTGWGATELLTSTGGTFPALAAAENGEVMAVYVAGGSLRSRRFVPGTGWAAEVSLAGTTTGVLAISMGGDAAGNALVVFIRNDGTRDSVYWARHTAAGGWTTAALLETDDTQSSTGAHVVVNADGTAVAVYALAGQLFALQFDGTAWSASTPIGARSSTNNLGSFPQEVGLAGGPIPAVVYASPVPGNVAVMVRQYVGGAWTPQAQLTDVEGAGQGHPAVATDGDGNALAVWRHTAGRSDVWGKRYVAGVGWGKAGPIEQVDPQDAFEPRVAIGGGGEAVVGWFFFDANATPRGNVWGMTFR